MLLVLLLAAWAFLYYFPKEREKLNGIERQMGEMAKQST
jgi:hypothetical protein